MKLPVQVPVAAAARAFGRSARRCLVALGAGTIVLVAAASGWPAAAAAPSPVSTRVTVFIPSTFTPIQVETGYCWVGSIASDRADAFRCMSGNAIHDPCFAFGLGTAVACPVDPQAGRMVLMVLTKPLPTGKDANRPGLAPTPWWGLLAGGGFCGVATGTTVDGRPFSCGLPGKGRSLTSVWCTWPAPEKGHPATYTSRCARTVTGSGGMPTLGKDRTYVLTQLWY